jgi:uncharacterized repeat protein (TIGR01451 family)
MNWRKSMAIINILMICALTLPGLFSGVSIVLAQVGTPIVVRVPAVTTAQIDRLGLTPLRSIDYGSYHWLELSPSDFSALRASGMPYFSVPEAGLVQITRYTFDPLIAGEPDVPADMRSSGSGAGFRLVQFNGPVKDHWLQQLADLGFRLLQYYPHNTFLVWGTAPMSEAAQGLDFVRWTGLVHPAYKINPDLDGRNGRITNVDVMFYNDGNIENTLAYMARLGGKIQQYYPAQPDQAFFDAIVELDASALDSLARLNTVLWIGYSHPEPVLDDEMSSQIVAGNYTAGVPFTGYYTWLGDIGFDGSGVRWAIVDTGVDYDHPDLGPHIVGGYDFPGACSYPGEPGSDCPGGGHGTHVAGIVGGDASGGFSDPNGFLYGLGIAPAYEIFAMNSLSAPSWPPAGGWQEHSKQAVLGGAIGGNNSWTTGEGTNHGYQSSERTHDIMVLDGNFDTTTVAEPFIEVFSAGNSGPAPSTLTAPKEAKNLIVTASSQNYRVGSIDNISSFSSRGPAVDGRWVPTITAPGEQIASSRNDDGGSCSTPIPGTNNLYAYCSGTSMASPHASGSVTLVTEWWRSFNSGSNPSAEMAKALLVNGAVDMGVADIPNINEGWGRIHLTNVMDNNTAMLYYDQPLVFDNSGETWSISLGVADPTKPLKVTLAWADAPGAVGANPALVNNLDLVIINGGTTYYGNQFSNGWSTPGGSPDAINNLENVYIQNPAGDVTITIQATNIAGDAVLYSGDTTDQDFALVCYNCVLQADFTLSSDPTQQAICAPADASYEFTVGSILGYSDPVTLSTFGAPSGTTSSFDVNPVTPPGNSTLTVGNTGAPGAGLYSFQVVGVAPTSTHTITLGLDIYDIVPLSSTLVSPADGAVDVNLSPTFQWDQAVQASAYDLQVATDPGFANVIYSATVETTSHTAQVTLDPTTFYYWRVQTSNVCGTGDWSAVFSFTTRGIPPILLVDDDDNGPDVRSYYTTVLDSLGLSYDIWDTQNSDNEPDAATLGNYQAVIWFSGDEYGGAAGPGTAGEAALGTFLQNGQCLLLSSQDYHYDRGTTNFMTIYLGVSSVSDDSGEYTSVTGVGWLFGGLGPYTLSYPFDDYSDIINPNANGELAFDGNNGNNAALNSTVYKATYWTFPFEAIASQANREEVLSVFLDWCGPLPEADLALDKAATPEITVGQQLTYTLTITNNGLTDAEAVTVVDNLPISVTFLEASPGCAEAGGVVTCDLGDLVFGASVEAEIVVLAPSVPGLITNQAQVSSTTPDPQPANNSDSVETLVLDEPVSGLEAINDSPTGLGSATALSATITSGSNVVYTWDYGDGENGAGANVQHTYAAIGVYEAVVTATNSSNVLTATTTVTVVDTPIVGLAANNDSPTELGSATALSATITGGSNVTFSWDFGDGEGGTGADVQHTYATVGVYEAIVTALNGSGIVTATTTVTVTDVEISGLSAISDSPTDLGQVTTLTATVEGGTNVIYTWDFDDGETGEGQVVTHTYTAAGKYTVIVTATNSRGSTSTTLVVVVVGSPEKMFFLPLIQRD